jgi:hypothetical protein
MSAIVQQPSDAACLMLGTPPGLPLLPHILAALELGPPPGLSPLPLSLASPFPPPGLCRSLLEGVGDDKPACKLDRSVSIDMDSQCSTADTAEEAIEEEEVVPQVAPKTLEEAGYKPGRVLRTEASLALSATPRLLSLVDTIEEPRSEGGMPGCPSVGSAGHHLGLCKPCDFVHRGSCRLGFACKFCHLCGPEANKQKKKERKKLLRAVRMQTAEKDEEQREEADVFSDELCGVCCNDSCSENAEGSDGASCGFRAAVLGGA